MRLTAEQRKEQIVRLATSMFAKNGYDGLTIRMLALACGISEPALYKYFPSKQAIYREVLQNLKKQLTIDKLESKISKSEDIKEILFTLARHIIDIYGSKPEFTRLLLFCSLENHDLSGEVFNIIRGPFVRILSEKLKKLKKSGKIREIDPEITARCFVGMVMDCSLGMDLWKNKQGRTFTSEKIIRNNIGIYVRGLKIP